MRRPGPELLDEISESALFRLGRGISACLAQLSDVLEAGVASGDFHVDDPTLLANHLYASGLGALQLARVGMLVKESAPGIPAISPVSPDQVTQLPRRDRHGARRRLTRVRFAGRPAIPRAAGRRCTCQREFRPDVRGTGAARYFSRIAVTPWPPAAQIEITPRPEPFSSSSLARLATIRPPVAANG